MKLHAIINTSGRGDMRAIEEVVVGAEMAFLIDLTHPAERQIALLSHFTLITRRLARENKIS